MKLKRPLKHCKLSQMQFFYWDELPEDDESDIIGGSNDPLFYAFITDPDLYRFNSTSNSIFNS